MKQKNLWQWLAANVLNIIGALMIAWGVPIGYQLLPFPDFYVFCPVGIILIGVSYYYKFVKKYD